MGREHDGRLAAQARDQLEEITPPLRVERADRLVEEQDLWSVDQCLGDAEPLPHPARIATDAALGRRRKPRPCEHLPDSGLERRAAEPMEPPDEFQQLAAFIQP